MDSFEVLELPPSSTEDEVRKAWKRLMLLHHPDRAGPKATEKCQQINAAYESIIQKKLYAVTVDKTTPQQPHSQTSFGIWPITPQDFEELIALAAQWERERGGRLW